MTAKRIVAMLMAACLILDFTAMTVAAEEVTAGKCGDNVTWVLDGDTLIISGTGSMSDYSELSCAPWSEYRETIQKIVVEEGVTQIGSYAFAELSKVQSVTLPSTLQAINKRAFYKVIGSGARYLFVGNAPEIAEDAFEGAYGVMSTVRTWDDSAKQHYGGHLSWYYKGKLLLNDTSKQHYALNEQILPEDFRMTASSFSETAPYVAENIQIGAYDNTAYGIKTVELTVDGHILSHEYVVTDGQNHLDAVVVQPDKYIYYDTTQLNVKPVVTAWGVTLKEGTHYQLSYSNNTSVTMDAKVTVTGIGMFAGYQSTHSFAILKQDIQKGNLWAPGVRRAYTGEPLDPVSVAVQFGQENIIEGTDYKTHMENNINVGTAKKYLVGLGNYYGFIGISANIFLSAKNSTLKGAYIGQADGELAEETYVDELLMPAGVFRAEIDSNKRHIAHYELYEMVGEELQLITTLDTEYNMTSNADYQKFEYDFSYIYDEENELGGRVFALYYAWVDSAYSVYSGLLVLGVYGKAPAAEAVSMVQVENDGDFRRDYLYLSAEEGDIGTVSWSSSDTSIAEVSQGQVTFKKPGTVTITGKNADGSLSANKILSVEQQDFAKAAIVDYNPKNGKVWVTYDTFMLTEGEDYTAVASQTGDITTVTIAGKGLFAGQLEQQYDAAGNPVDHTHSFDHCEDATCNGCDYTRQKSHNIGDKWVKNQDGHWHVCGVCGEKTGYAAHEIDPENRDNCLVCGQIVLPGDFNGDNQVTDADALYLLRHVLFESVYPANQNADVNADGSVTDTDALYLLRHSLFPNLYPLFP